MSDGYFDRQGKALDMMSWCKLLEDKNYKRVAADTIGEADVSTVWLGLNHAWDRDAAPLIFETMILGGPHDGYQERYATEQAALDGHAVAVALVRGES